MANASTRKPGLALTCTFCLPLYKLCHDPSPNTDNYLRHIKITRSRIQLCLGRMGHATQILGFSFTVCKVSMNYSVTSATANNKV